ncbi:MAG TPA: hypothetical protein VMV72_11390 [Verrucomicrobiae bacterium]|nr:hypothetical protein [Verrucomicrobiae bacterium]
MIDGHENQTDVGRWTRWDGAAVALVLVVALAVRIPFRSQLAYHWDSAQFALALGEYDLRDGQPQPPGFYLYVVLGRLVNLVVGEPHAALVWLSVIAGAWLVAAGYLLATSMFGRECGWATGLILLTSPLCWFHSEVALTTIVDSALVTSFVLLGWRAIRQRVTWFQTVLLAALLAAVAGVRQQTAPCLIPLGLYVLWRAEQQRGWKLLCAIALTVSFSLFWFIPTMRSAGGFASYIHLLRLKNQFDAHQTVWGGGGLKAFWTNIGNLSAATWVGLLAAALIFVIEFILWSVFEKPTAKDHLRRAHRLQFHLLALWIAPMVLFWLLMYVTMPGYALNFFPAVAIFAALGLVRHSGRLSGLLRVRRGWTHCGVLGFVVAINSIIFVLQPVWAERLLAGMPLTGVEIRRHDADLSACFQAIRRKWAPANVVICHGVESFYWGFRQFEYHLPEYRNVLLFSDASSADDLGRKTWVGYHWKTTFQSDFGAADGQHALLAVPPGLSPDIFGHFFDVRGASLVVESGMTLYELH